MSNFFFLYLNIKKEIRKLYNSEKFLENDQTIKMLGIEKKKGGFRTCNIETLHL